MSRAAMIREALEPHVDPDKVGSVAELIVDHLDREDFPLSPREGRLMAAMWMIVKAAGGKVRVSPRVQQAFTPGVDRLDARMDPVTRSMIYEVAKP